MVGGLAGCGGSSDDDEPSAKEVLALQQAREQGRKEAQDEARAKKLARDAAALRKEVAELRKGSKGEKGKSSSGSSSSAAAAAPKPAATGGGTKSCGGGITVNSVTSCEFAQNVRDEYYRSGGSSSISAYSPATGQTYSLSCSGSSATTCSGGNGAQVIFP